jgi:hypothetical protein
MVKYLLIAVLLFNSTAYAGELQITKSVIHYKESNDVKVFVYNPKGTATKTRHTYSAILITKNISKSNISVATGLLTPRQERVGDQPVEITIKHDKVLSSESDIIPSISDLKIVTLRPNESARIKFDFKSYKMIDEAYVGYSMYELYDNRFGYWTGSVKSNLIHIENPK